MALPVNLSGWTAEGGGNWVVAGDQNSVRQTVNGNPTVFHNGTASQGTALSGTITVETRNDDDFVGFVLGYDAGELTSASADYWLIDWKQGNQGAGAAGLALSHVTGNPATTAVDDFWNHNGVVSEAVRGTTLGATGWADLTTYTFDLVFTASLIEVYVNGALEISHAGTFGNGGFGFYNYSQDSVRYAGITQEQLPGVPLPAGAPLLLGGLGLLGLLRTRRSKTV